jgi:hypothetical protein
MRCEICGKSTLGKYCSKHDPEQIHLFKQQKKLFEKEEKEDDGI